MIYLTIIHYIICPCRNKNNSHRYSRRSISRPLWSRNTKSISWTIVRNKNIRNSGGWRPRGKRWTNGARNCRTNGSKGSRSSSNHFGNGGRSSWSRMRSSRKCTLRLQAEPSDNRWWSRNNLFSFWKSSKVRRILVFDENQAPLYIVMLKLKTYISFTNTVCTLAAKLFETEKLETRFNMHLSNLRIRMHAKRHILKWTMFWLMIVGFMLISPKVYLNLRGRERVDWK